MPLKKTGRRTERRREARADAHLSMRVEAPPADGELTQIVTESENISASGVYCYSPNYLAPLSKVALTIVLPSVPGRRGAQRLLKCDGVVVRCMSASSRTKERQFQMACSFIGLEEPDRRLLDDFVTWRNLHALRQAVAPARRTTRRNGTSRTRTTTATTTRSSRTPARSGTRRKAARTRRTVH